MTDSDAVAKLIREVAQAEIVPRFRALKPDDIREKAPGDLVTRADTETERALTRRLPELLPGSVVLGEEAAAENRGRLAVLAGADPVWVIDPVDGTANFARGREGFGVIVALVRGGDIRAGWIYDPLADVMVTAEPGAGTWSAGRRLAVAREIAAGEATGAAYGRAASGQRAAQALAASGRIGQVRNLGCSALEYIEVAAGRMHFTLHSRSLPWDHAAGMLAIAEAGGLAGFADGAPYDPRIIDRVVLAAANRPVWDAVKAVVASPA